LVEKRSEWLPCGKIQDQPFDPVRKNGDLRKLAGRMSHSNLRCRIVGYEKRRRCVFAVCGPTWHMPFGQPMFSEHTGTIANVTNDSTIFANDCTDERRGKIAGRC